MHIPYLREKLHFLYASGLNPDITNARQLASRLGVSPSTVASWVNGSGGMAPSAIPEKRILEICLLFGIDYPVFTGRHGPDEFEPRVLGDKSGWKRLLGQSERPVGELQIVPVRDPDHEGKRAVTFLGDHQIPDVYTLPLWARFRLRVHGRIGSHVILLLQHPEGVQCMDLAAMTTHGASSLLEQESYIPAQSLPSLQTERPAGHHCWLAVLSAAEWPSALSAGLISEDAVIRDRTLIDLDVEILKRRKAGDSVLAIWRLPFFVRG